MQQVEITNSVWYWFKIFLAQMAAIGCFAFVVLIVVLIVLYWLTKDTNNA